MFRGRRNYNRKKVSLRERVSNILKNVALTLSTFSALLLLLILYRTISELEVFSVREIEIKGNNFLSEEYLSNITDIRRDNIFNINLENLRINFLKSPWIKEATVRRELPNTIRIQLQERVSVAMVDYGDFFYLVDGEGVIIERIRDRKDYSLPLISGVDLSEGQLGERCIEKGLSEGLTLLRFLKDNGFVLNDIEVVAKEPEDLTVNIAGRQVKIGSGSYHEKFRRLNEIEKELERKRILASSIDLRFSGKVIVVPMKEGSF